MVRAKLKSLTTAVTALVTADLSELDDADRDELVSSMEED